MGTVGAGAPESSSHGIEETLPGDVGNIATKQGRLVEARAYLERSLAIFERAWGPHHPEVASALDDLALVAVAAERPADGRALAERAVAILEASEASESVRSIAAFVLAQCLWGPTRAERERAVAAAEKARERFAALGESSREEREEVEAWLDARRRMVAAR